jgi:hypothetical protein
MGILTAGAALTFVDPSAMLVASKKIDSRRIRSWLAYADR